MNHVHLVIPRSQVVVLPKPRSSVASWPRLCSIILDWYRLQPEDHKFLHFELCYYQAIDFAINNNYKSVEAGAQGTHKISRGYSPEITYSAHWMKEKNFSDAIQEYLKYEVLEVEKSKKILENYLPFKKEG